MSSGEPLDRIRIALRLDRFDATIEVSSALAPEVWALFIDELRMDGGVGSLLQIDDHGTIRLDGRLWDPGEDQTLLDQLVYVLMQASLDADPDRLHLHTGLVSRNGRSLLLGGVSGSGKSTLVAQLVERGFDYFTDERVALDRGMRLGALPKPISVVSGSFTVLEGSNPTRTGLGASSHRLWHVPASSVRPESVGHPLPDLGAIVLVEYRPGSETVAEPMHPITVARVLLSDSIDVDRFGPDGPLLVTQLCASVPCFSLIHNGTTEAESVLTSLLDRRRPHPASEVSEVTGLASTGQRGHATCAPDSVLSVAPGVRGAVAADRALLQVAGGTLVELDESQTAWLQLLDGETSVEALVAEVAGAVGSEPAAMQRTALVVLDGLVAMGVVE